MVQKQTRSNQNKNEINKSKKSTESKRKELENTKATLIASQQNFTNLDINHKHLSDDPEKEKRNKNQIKAQYHESLQTKHQEQEQINELKEE